MGWNHQLVSQFSKAMGALPMVGISTALLTYTAMGYPLEPDVVAMSVAYFDAWMLVVCCGLGL